MFIDRFIAGHIATHGLPDIPEWREEWGERPADYQAGPQTWPTDPNFIASFGPDPNASAQDMSWDDIVKAFGL